jgi:hypothetical protein
MMERDVAMAVAATAAAMSPRAREFVRKGAVYGLAGMLRAGDVVVGTAKGAARGAQEGFSADGQSAGGRRSQPRARQKAAR